MVAKRRLLTGTVDLIRQAHLDCSKNHGRETGTVDLIRQAHLAVQTNHGRQTGTVDGDC